LAAIRPPIVPTPMNPTRIVASLLQC